MTGTLEQNRALRDVSEAIWGLQQAAAHLASIEDRPEPLIVTYALPADHWHLTLVPDGEQYRLTITPTR